MWEYLINSAAWSVGGLIIGFFLGRAQRDISEIKDKVEHDDS